ISLLHLRRSFLLRVPLPGSVSAASSHGCSTAVALHHRRLLAMSLEFPLQPNKTPIWEPLNSDSSRGPASIIPPSNKLSAIQQHLKLPFELTASFS
ncbi:hypothetical protein LINGRAHAP2_LOCUS14016, partial [Linum grandiflorum]